MTEFRIIGGEKGRKPVAGAGRAESAVFGPPAPGSGKSGPVESGSEGSGPEQSGSEQSGPGGFSPPGPAVPASSQTDTIGAALDQGRQRTTMSWLTGSARRRPVLWVSALAVIVFIIWAANAPLEEVTRGPGKVIPFSRSQVIQSLEGGIVREIPVREGDVVTPGQVLAVLDDTRFRTAHADLQSQTIALKAALARLRAELAGASTIDFPAEVLDAPELVAIETELFEARRRKLIETERSLSDRIRLATEELNLVRPVVQQGAVSAVDEIRLERAVADFKGELTEARNTYYQEVNTDIAKKSAELDSLMQQMAQKQDALARTQLRSPVRGIVKNLEVTTRGGVVDPGETIMEVVPLDDRLYVEARIRPQDVAFLREGLPASVKITAYDYSIYGDLDGELTYISADTLIDETQRDPQPYYGVRVLTDSASLNGPDGPLPIKPGMVAEVAIQTGSKTVLEYLLKPLTRGQEALGER